MNGIIIGGVVLVLILLVGLVWVFGSRAKARLVAKYPPPGQLIDVGGYRLHIDCQGDPSAQPTVIMDAGQGEFSLTWALVQPEVARFARVCAYDRAGLGWSEASPKARTASNIVEEFQTLLTRAGIEPPYLLVGHSAGGLYAQLYAQAHPEDVVGMVLVDSAHPELDVRTPQSLIKLNKRAFTAMGCGFRFLQLLQSIGLLALVPNLVDRLWFSPSPRGARETQIGVICSRIGAFEALRKEPTSAWANLAEARSAQITTLGDIPLVVLSRGQGDISGGPGISAEDLERFEAANDEMQDELAALSPLGKRIVAEESGHYIQVSQPEMVIDAIRDVVASARDPNGAARERS
jgi:pimeloyl-ACP methyl ester carboxylesterase